MHALRAVVFDLDDTLYPETEFVVSGFRAVAAWAEEHLGIPAVEGFAELWALFEQGIRGNTFNRWLADRNVLPDPWIPKMVQIYRGHVPQIVPYPGVPELLRRLRQRYRLGLVTDGYVDVQRRKLAALGLMAYFNAIVISEELGEEAYKPSTQPFKILLNRLDVEGQEAVYIADNPQKDFLGARRLGMWTVRIRRPDGLYSHLEPPSPEHAPHMEIDNLSRLEGILVKLEHCLKSGQVRPS